MGHRRAWMSALSGSKYKKASTRVTFCQPVGLGKTVRPGVDSAPTMGTFGHRTPGRSPGWARGLALALALLAGPPCLAARPQTLAEAQELLDAGRPEAALALLDALLEKDKKNAQALLLRSTARFLLDDVAAGEADLDRALELDPGLRQGWLNRAALDLAEKRHDSALEALLKARDLDPAAPDNDINLGAVLLLKGELGRASQHFQRYLEQSPGSAEAYYLVATNYAMSGYAALAVEHLRRAIEQEERSRLRARADANFVGLEANPQFRELLAADLYRPPPGAHAASRSFAVPYETGERRLLNAVIDALGQAGEPFDARIEVTPGWALIWGDMRIKVGPGVEEGEGRVEMTAPAERFTPAEWQRRTEEVFRQIAIRLVP